MKCKTFECPYLTEEDKKFLEYEQKIYEESAKEIIASKLALCISFKL